MAAYPGSGARNADSRDILTDMYWAAVEAASPAAALSPVLDRIEALNRRTWIIAVGKAAHAMSESAVDALRKKGLQPAGGVIVAPQAAIPPHPALAIAVGNHPIPGPRSFAAAARIGDVVARIRPEDEVWVLLSGGASSLIAAPEGVVKPEELVELYRLLLDSGLDVAHMNAVRKRFSRWGAGRLAHRLAPARVRCFAISDVVGDDMTAIASGPCVPDPTTANDVRAILSDCKLWDDIPLAMRRYLAAVERDPELETPKPGDPVFWEVERRVVANNRAALAAAATRADDYGFRGQVLTASLTGEAAIIGRRLAVALLGQRDTGDRACLIWGGETTVSLGGTVHGTGGRCQELALAAAQELAGANDAVDAALLAAGTDGRDGLTDAAGAIVDATTWATLARVGFDAEYHLRTHDSYPALESAGALLKTGATGTNVMDVVIGLIR
ncbi:MAG: DUF4147 domain-containing protein [Gemmatimonadaceae bacterium]